MPLHKDGKGPFGGWGWVVFIVKVGVMFPVGVLKTDYWGAYFILYRRNGSLFAMDVTQLTSIIKGHDMDCLVLDRIRESSCCFK